MSQTIWRVVVIRYDNIEVYNKLFNTEEEALKDVERIKKIIQNHNMKSKYEILCYPEIIVD